MTPQDESWRGDVGPQAAEIVRDALRELRALRADADLSRDQEYELAAALANAVKRGVQLGVVEAVAQAIQKGHDIDLKVDIGDIVPPDDLKP